MARNNNRSVSPFRRACGDYDLLVIAIVALLIVIALIFVALQILGHSEEHVEKVRETRIPYKESLRWRAENLASETGIQSELESDPNRLKANYADMNLNDHCLELIGRMSRLEELNLTRAVMKDSSLRHIVKLPLRSLGLQGATVTDRAIPFILEIPTLRKLLIGDTDVTDAGIEALAKSTSINSLGISEGRCLTGKSLEYVGKMSQLIVLELGQSDNLSADSLVHLERLNNLAELSLKDLTMNNEQIRKFNNLKHLTHLESLNCQLNDPAVTEIAALKALQVLVFRNEEFSDKGLMSLTKLKNLKRLGVHWCPYVSPDGIEKFRSIKPDCRVDYTAARKLMDRDLMPEIDLLEGEVKGSEF